MPEASARFRFLGCFSRSGRVDEDELADELEEELELEADVLWEGVSTQASDELADIWLPSWSCKTCSWPATTYARQNSGKSFFNQI